MRNCKDVPGPMPWVLLLGRSACDYYEIIINCFGPNLMLFMAVGRWRFVQRVPGPPPQWSLPPPPQGWETCLGLVQHRSLPTPLIQSWRLSLPSINSSLSRSPWKPGRGWVSPPWWTSREAVEGQAFLEAGRPTWKSGASEVGGGGVRVHLGEDKGRAGVTARGHARSPHRRPLGVLVSLSHTCSRIIPAHPLGARLHTTHPPVLLSGGDPPAGGRGPQTHSRRTRPSPGNTTGASQMTSDVGAVSVRFLSLFWPHSSHPPRDPPYNKSVFFYANEKPGGWALSSFSKRWSAERPNRSRGLGLRADPWAPGRSEGLEARFIREVR